MPHSVDSTLSSIVHMGACVCCKHAKHLVGGRGFTKYKRGSQVSSSLDFTISAGDMMPN
jgi:hypothetical protein